METNLIDWLNYLNIPEGKSKVLPPKKNQLEIDLTVKYKQHLKSKLISKEVVREFLTDLAKLKKT